MKRPGSRYAERRRAGLAAGTWKPFVDARPVTDHCQWLRSMGMGTSAIAAASGLPHGTVTALVWPGMSPRTKVRAVTADAILAVRDPLRSVPDGGFVFAVGTARRVQALRVAGWSWCALADRLGVYPQQVCFLCRQGRVSGRMARKVAALFVELEDVPGPSPDAARRARAAGWAPAAAWDNIDDPAAEPSGHLVDVGGTVR